MHREFEREMDAYLSHLFKGFLANTLSFLYIYKGKKSRLLAEDI